MTKYVSTRNKKSALYAHEAIIRGLSEDGGLYTPLAMDIHIDPAELLDLTYQQQASRIIGAFFDDYTPAEIEQCTKGAYDEKFDTEEIVPLRKFQGGWLMDLWHGPTSAFKDIALTILPRLLSTAYQKENRDDTIAILTATSGDTGKAALSGFADVPNTAITVFYPEIGVSEIQKLQMQTSTGDNVDVIAVSNRIFIWNEYIIVSHFHIRHRLIDGTQSRIEILLYFIIVRIGFQSSDIFFGFVTVDQCSCCFGIGKTQLPRFLHLGLGIEIADQNAAEKNECHIKKNQRSQYLDVQFTV